MSDTTIEQTEVDIIAYEVSDDALEAVTGTESKRAGNYTLYFCTALDLCPGP